MGQIRTQLISFYPGTESDKNILKELNAKHAEAFARSKVGGWVCVSGNNTAVKN